MAQADRAFRVALQRLLEHDRRDEHLAQPADERVPARIEARRRDAAPVDGPRDAQRAGASRRGGRVETLPRVSRGQQARGHGAEVEAPRGVLRGAPRQRGDGEAVDGALAGGDDPQARACRGERLNPQPFQRAAREDCGFQRTAEELRFVCGQFGRADERDEAELREFGIAVEAVPISCPSFEFRRRCLGVAGEEGGRADGEVFLVLDR